MDASCESPSHRRNAEALLQSFVAGARGRALRVQLAEGHHGRSPEEIDDAIQTACERFVKAAEGIADQAEVYAWIRTTAHRLLNREDERRSRELSVDPIEGGLDRAASEEPGPAEELIALEEEGEMAALVREVTSSLPARRRDVLALYVAGHKRPEIAARLRVSDRVVKRELLEIMDEARTVLARREGGGCERGEPLVLRWVYGLATAAEAAQAKLHLERCHRCEALQERLLAWREKAATMLPAPTVEVTSPGVLERVAHRTAEGLASIKQQVTDGVSQLKQQAAVSYYRTVDPTPLAGARPGTVAAVVAGCLTLGTGAATYCVQQGVNPIGGASALIGGGEESKATENATSSSDKDPAQPVYEPVPPPEEVTQAPQEKAPPPEPEPEPTPQKEPEPEPEPEPTPPPEEQFFGEEAEYTASESSEPQEPEPAPSQPMRPAPVPPDSPPEFGGP